MRASEWEQVTGFREGQSASKLEFTKTTSVITPKVCQGGCEKCLGTHSRLARHEMIAWGLRPPPPFWKQEHDTGLVGAQSEDPQPDVASGGRDQHHFCTCWKRAPPTVCSTSQMPQRITAPPPPPPHTLSPLPTYTLLQKPHTARKHARLHNTSKSGNAEAPTGKPTLMPPPPPSHAYRRTHMNTSRCAPMNMYKAQDRRILFEGPLGGPGPTSPRP